MKGIIIEDNFEVVKLLTQFIKEYPGNLTLVGFAMDLEQGKALIEEVQPDLLILDIRLGETYVFDLLDSINADYLQNTSLLFISAYFEADYIHEALKFAAVDYLLKPISRQDFYQALDKAIEANQQKNVFSVVNRLKTELEKLKTVTFGLRLIVVKTDGCIRKIDHKDVLYMEIKNKLVHIITPHEVIASQKTLKNYDDLLSPLPNFMRTSKTTIVNIDFVNSLDRQNRILSMNNGAKIPCSRRKFSQLLKLFEAG